MMKSILPKRLNIPFIIIHAKKYVSGSLFSCRLVIFLFLLFHQVLVFSQAAHTTKNDYTGDWSDPFSWEPIWNLPQLEVDMNVTINGYISCQGSVEFSGMEDTLIINDTLVIFGDLYLGNKNYLIVNDHAILIIRGDLTAGNKTSISTNAFIVITGDFRKEGAVDNGQFVSADSVSNVFIGGTIWPENLDTALYPVLKCPGDNPYDNSGCSYGNMTDLMSEPIYSFFETVCPPVFIISPGEPLCESDSRQLQGSISEGVFSIISGPGSIQNDILTATGEGVIGIRFADEKRCLDADTQFVIVNPRPVAVITISDHSGKMENDGVLCSGDTVLLTATGGEIFQWGNGELTDKIFCKESGSYYVIITDSNGCSDTAFAEVMVHPLPVAKISVTETSGISDDDGAVCAADQALLTASGGEIYEWNTGETSDSLITGQAGEYLVLVTDTDGCSETAEFMLIVNNLPSPSIEISENSGTTENDGILCEGETARLTASGGIIYLWSSGEQTARISKGTEGEYTVLVTDTNGCRGSTSVDLQVTILPVVNAGSDAQVCGLEYTLNGTSANPFEWAVNSSPGEVTFTSGNETLSPRIVVSETGEYTFILKSVYQNCVSEDEVSIGFHLFPEANAGADQHLNDVFSADLQAELGASETGKWTTIAGSGYIRDIFSPQTLITGLSSGLNIFKWTVSDGYCSDEDTVILYVDELFLPQVITPNNDSKNDCFIIKDVEKNGPVFFSVLNRWGNEVYMTDDYLNDWCGYSENGHQLPDDTYYYILGFPGGKTVKGFIVIKRK